MGWLITLDALLWIGAVVLFFAGYGWFALICGILAVVLLLFLSPRVVDGISDIFLFLD